MNYSRSGRPRKAHAAAGGSTCARPSGFQERGVAGVVAPTTVTRASHKTSPASTPAGQRQTKSDSRTRSRLHSRANPAAASTCGGLRPSLIFPVVACSKLSPLWLRDSLSSRPRGCHGNRIYAIVIGPNDGRAPHWTASVSSACQRPAPAGKKKPDAVRPGETVGRRAD
jgi:hypothetical protein